MRELSVARTLLEAAAALPTELDLDQLLSRLAQIAVESTGIRRAFVNLIDAEHRVLIPKVAIGGLNAPGGSLIPLDNLSQTSQTAIRNKRTAILDYELPSTPREDREIAAANEARLVLFVPLIFKGEITGHISLDQPNERYAFSETQIEVINGIAAHAAIAVENARLLEQTVRSNARLAMDLEATASLHEISTVFVHEGSLESVLERIVDAAVAITGADMGHLQLLDPVSECLTIAAQRGFDRFFVDFWNAASTEQGPCNVNAKTRQRVIIEDIESVSELLDDASIAIQREAGIRALQSTPLVGTSGALLGMLSTHYRQPGRPDTQALRFLDLLARQAADMIAWTVSERALRDAMAGVDAERARLRQIIDEIPVGVALVAPDGAVVEVNEANRQLWGGVLPRARSIAEYTLYEGHRHGSEIKLEAEDWPAPRAIASKEPVEDLVDFVRSDGTTGIIRIAAIPILDKNETLESVVVITEDVTEPTRERELDDALAGIAAAVGSTLDEDRILDHLVTMAHAALGSEAARAVLSARGTWRIAHTVDCPQTLENELLTEESELASLSMIECHVVKVQDARTDARISSSNPSVLSLLAVPLVIQGAAEGVLLFDHFTRPADFSPAQISFAKRIMHTASGALDSARMYQREHRIAKTLQEAILAPPDALEGVEMGFLYRPASAAANVGGDFYDLLATSEGHVAVTIGDVSGKGLEAARLTSLMRDGVRAYLVEDEDPGSVLCRLNTLAYRSTPTEMFTTAFLGVLDPVTGLLRYCGAGHPAALIAGPRGIESLTSQGGLVGAFDTLDLASRQTVLSDGDVLVLYTDGVTEVRSGSQMLDESGLAEIVSELADVSVDELPQRILDRVLDFAGGYLHDDVVIVCLRRSGEAHS